MVSRHSPCHEGEDGYAGGYACHTPYPVDGDTEENACQGAGDIAEGEAVEGVLALQDGVLCRGEHGEYGCRSEGHDPQQGVVSVNVAAAECH